MDFIDLEAAWGGMGGMSEKVAQCSFVKSDWCHLCALGSFPSRFSAFFFLSAIDKVLLAAQRGDGDSNPQVQV